MAPKTKRKQPAASSAGDDKENLMAKFRTLEKKELLKVICHKRPLVCAARLCCSDNLAALCSLPGAVSLCRAVRRLSCLCSDGNGFLKIFNKRNAAVNGSQLSPSSDRRSTWNLNDA